MRDTHQFETGDRLHERYEIRETLGSGGFGMVYRAFDTVIKRPVAIKVLDVRHTHSHDEEKSTRVLDRFLREAQVAARIRHQCIVEIHDFGVFEEEENPYIIMEFLEGADLGEELLENGPLDPSRLFPLFVDVLEGLGEAHAEGIVHKDLKPANLFLSQRATRRETLKIVDFGIAHVNAPTEERITTTGAVCGTPQYLAPEYIRDQQVSPALDIYQMGLILVEGLTAKPVVNSSNLFQAALMHVDRKFCIPPSLLEGAFGEVIKRATAFEPDDRFESAESFADALASIDPETVQIPEVKTLSSEATVSPVADTIPWSKADEGDGDATFETAPTEKEQTTDRELRDDDQVGEESSEEPPEEESEEPASISDSVIEIAVAAASNRWTHGVVFLAVGLIIGAVVFASLSSTDSTASTERLAEEQPPAPMAQPEPESALETTPTVDESEPDMASFEESDESDETDEDTVVAPEEEPEDDVQVGSPEDREDAEEDRAAITSEPAEEPVKQSEPVEEPEREEDPEAQEDSDPFRLAP